jgi:hypothetical protein
VSSHSATVSKNATKVLQRLTYTQNAVPPELARLSKRFSAKTLINVTQLHDLARKSCYGRMTRSETLTLAPAYYLLGP